MSNVWREQWESRGFRSLEAMNLAGSIARKATLALPDTWVHAVEARAIAAFISYQSAATRKHSGEAIKEDQVVACARFGVDPLWFYTDDDGTVDEDAALSLRAQVAHYRVMHRLDQ